jgi:glycosyltransferase involved in cell wall biosynthesis
VNRLLVLYSSHSVVCGIGTWLESLTETLASRGWEVIVGLSWGARFHEPAVVDAARPALQTVWIDGRSGTRAGRWQSIVEVVRKTRPSIALVTLLDDGVRALSAAKADLRLRVAIANHGNSPSHLAVILEEHRRLDLAVTVNRRSYELLRTWPDAAWSDDVLHCIPNCVPIPRGQPRREETLGPIRIGLIGRLAEDKGAEQLPRLVDELLARQLPFELWIAGDGPLRTTIESLAIKHPQFVRYLGTMTGRALQDEVYPLLDVILCLSPSEGWPLAMAEGMAHGAVPVTSSFVGLREEGIIRQEETGLIFPYADLPAAAAMIQRLATDQTLRRRLGGGASAEITENYSPARFGQEWAGCLEQCLSRPPRISSNERRAGEFAFTSRIKESARRVLGMRVPHASVRSEWPMFQPTRFEVEDQVRRALLQAAPATDVAAATCLPAQLVACAE